MNKGIALLAALSLMACSRDLLTVDDLDVTLGPESSCRSANLTSP